MSIICSLLIHRGFQTVHIAGHVRHNSLSALWNIVADFVLGNEIFHIFIVLINH